MPVVTGLFRYPVKGFSPEALDSAELQVGRPVGGDRIFAVENGPSGFDPAAPSFQPKAKFLCLMKNARLASLATHYDAATSVWSIRHGDIRFSANLESAAGRRAAEVFLEGFMGEELRGPLKILSAEGHTFSDVGKPLVSFINLASVQQIGDWVGAIVDPLRFRANVYVDGIEPFRELDLVGREAKIGSASLRFVKRTQRCVATNVDPASAVRDLDIPGTLRRELDHMDCGIYAEVIAAGTVRPGDALELA